MVNYRHYIDEAKLALAKYIISHEGYMSMQIINAVAGRMENSFGGDVSRWQGLCDELFDNMIRDCEIIRRNYEWQAVGVQFHYPTLKEDYVGL